MTKKQSWQELESNLGARGDRQKKGISEAGHVCSRTSVACCDQEQGKKKRSADGAVKLLPLWKPFQITLTIYYGIVVVH